MALSVSGFPEPSRHPGSSNEVFTGESSQDGYGKATLMNSPRLRGLFGSNSGTGKKPDPKNSPTTSKSDTEVEPAQSAITTSTPPTTPSFSFSSSSFEPLSQQEYELELQLPSMNMPLDPPRAHKRAQLPPLPRKTTASPVRLGPNLARLEIGGTWNRSPPTSHTHPKPLPPSVVVQEWGSKAVDTSSSTQPQPRPLPSVPGNTADPAKYTSNAVAGPSRLVAAAVPLPGTSRNVNAVAGPSKQSNASAGPSKHPNALNLSPTQVNSPVSKVLITQPTPQRAHRQNSPSFSMRYQSLVAEPSTVPLTEEAAPPASTANLSSPIRPLPRIPLPTTSAVTVRPEPIPTPSSRQTSGASIKRPRTSPSSISGFSIPGSSTLALSRSPFDNITSSWATRPMGLHALRAHSPPLPLSPGMRPPRARSHSRPRRDRSLDSYYASPKSAKTSSTFTGNPSGGRQLRSLPSPTIGGARPLPKKAATMDQFPLPSKPLRIQTTNVAISQSSGTSGTSSGSSRVFSPSGKRSQPPSPPSGPVKPRLKPSPILSPVIHAPIPTSRSLPTPHTEPLQISPARSNSDQEDFSAANETITIDTQSMDAPLHSHPKEAFADSESLLHPVSPSTAESPVEVFIDDNDLSTLSRSPSPIRYARPDSRGNLSESDDDDISSSSSPSLSRSSSPERRRRTQLRSYRHSYRPRAGTSPPHIPYRLPSPSPVPEQLPPHLRLSKKKKEERKARSYFGTTASGSAPATRASSPERKSRSRQPRRLAEAVTSALEEVRNRGRGPSSSPKRKLKSASAGGSGLGTPALSAPIEMEVLDISLPSLSGRETTATVDTGSSYSDTVPPATSSARSSLKGGWAKTMVRKRSDTGDHNSNSESGTVAHLSSVVAGVELDGAETPYMWVSASKPPISPAPFFSPLPPSHHSHRRTDSLDDYPLLKHPAESGEVDKSGASGGIFIGGKIRSVETTITSTITSTVTVSRPPSAPFSAFSLASLASNKSKKKRTASLTTSRSTVDERDPPLIVRKEQEGDEIDWMEDEKRSDDYPELEGEVVVVTTKRVMRSVDHDGDIWEHEQETGVADVIPHLRNLKASKS